MATVSHLDARRDPRGRGARPAGSSRRRSTRSGAASAARSRRSWSTHMPGADADPRLPGRLRADRLGRVPARPLRAQRRRHRAPRRSTILRGARRPMTADLILAIDQGTTNTKALLVDAAGRVIASASVKVPVAFPRPGWVESDGQELWATVEAAIDRVPARDRRRRAWRPSRSPTSASRCSSGSARPDDRWAPWSAGSAAAPPSCARRSARVARRRSSTRGPA